MKLISTITLSSFLFLTLVGCGTGNNVVNGAVTFDGEPLASGSITFIRSEGDAVREGAVIKDGSFQVRLPPGKYKVEVNAKKLVGTRTQKDFDGKMEEVEITDELIPERYNSKTELIEEVKSGSRIIKLDLKSAKGQSGK